MNLIKIKSSKGQTLYWWPPLKDANPLPISHVWRGNAVLIHTRSSVSMEITGSKRLLLHHSMIPNVPVITRYC